MSAGLTCWLRWAVVATFACSWVALADDDDDAKNPAKAAAQAAAPTLSREQQSAVGLRVAHPLAAAAPERTLALGTVLDATGLLSDEGELEVAGALEHSTSAELARLRELYQGGAGASLRMLEAAQAEQAKALAQVRLASAQFAQNWGPLASGSPGERQKLLESVTSGHSVLVRADLPGRHMLGSTPKKALLDVDGVQVPGRVLGALRRSTEAQTVGLLVEVPNPPLGLATGARVPMSLLHVEHAGLLLPRDAVLYDESGAYVYKQLAGKTPGEKTHYVAVKVTLLLPYGDGWLLKGVDDDDDIVVQGAGVLWSLEGVGAHPADDDED